MNLKHTVVAKLKGHSSLRMFLLAFSITESSSKMFTSTMNSMDVFVLESISLLLNSFDKTVDIFKKTIFSLDKIIRPPTICYHPVLFIG